MPCLVSQLHLRMLLSALKSTAQAAERPSVFRKALICGCVTW